MTVKPPGLLGIHARPTRLWRWILATLPFLLVIGIYVVASDARHQENPKDKLLPTIGQMAAAVDRMALTEDRRTGRYLMLADTKASLTRLSLGVLLAAISSFRVRPHEQDLVVFGEVGLTGEIRPVPNGQERLKEAAKHGFKRAIVPRANTPKRGIDGLDVVAVDNLADLLQRI